MSVKELKEGIEKGKVIFGIKQILKFFSKTSAKKGKEDKEEKKGKKKEERVFLVKDAREETAKKLKEAGIEFSFLKNRTEVAKELNLNFESEVFLLK